MYSLFWVNLNTLANKCLQTLHFSFHMAFIYFLSCFSNIPPNPLCPKYRHVLLPLLYKRLIIFHLYSCLVISQGKMCFWLCKISSILLYPSPQDVKSTLVGVNKKAFFKWRGQIEIKVASWGIIQCYTHSIFLVPFKGSVEEIHGNVFVLIKPLNDKWLEPPNKEMF